MTGCASVKEKPSYSKPQRSFPDSDEASLLVYDPIEPFNRTMYNFNARFDRSVFLPAVAGYRAVTPDIVERGVTNFFNNLREIRYLFNNLLQVQIKDSGITLSRFVINTTVGIVGIWDPATKMALYVREEDFGQTLGFWGVGNGAYVVLPIFGPSNLRDAGGIVVDNAVYINLDILELEDSDKDGIRIALLIIEAIDLRKNTEFRYYETGSPFEYELVRYIYTKIREAEIAK